jgi:hypothetical protein
MRIEGEGDERPVEYSLLSRPSQRIVQERLTNALSLCLWDDVELREKPEGLMPPT